MMIPLVLVFVVLLIALPIVMGLLLVASCASLVWTGISWVWSFPLRRWRARRRLPEDWWAHFERDLDAYNHPDVMRARQKERSL
jgi:hypothetical protein